MNGITSNANDEEFPMSAYKHCLNQVGVQARPWDISDTVIQQLLTEDDWACMRGRNWSI